MTLKSNEALRAAIKAEVWRLIEAQRRVQEGSLVAMKRKIAQAIQAAKRKDFKTADYIFDQAIQQIGPGAYSSELERAFDKVVDAFPLGSAAPGFDWQANSDQYRILNALDNLWKVADQLSQKESVREDIDTQKVNLFISRARTDLSAKRFQSSFGNLNRALSMPGVKQNVDLYDAIIQAREKVLDQNELGAVQWMDKAVGILSRRESVREAGVNWNQVKRHAAIGTSSSAPGWEVMVSGAGRAWTVMWKSPTNKVKKKSIMGSEQDAKDFAEKLFTSGALTESVREAKAPKWRQGQELGIAYRVPPFLSDDRVKVTQVQRQTGLRGTVSFRYHVQTVDGKRQGWMYEDYLKESVREATKAQWKDEQDKSTATYKGFELAVFRQFGTSWVANGRKAGSGSGGTNIFKSGDRELAKQHAEAWADRGGSHGY